MPGATVEQVCFDAAAALGEREAEIFNTDALLPHFRNAYSDLWNLMMKWGLQKPKRTAYAILAANYNILDPEDAGISDFGEPLELRECGSITTVSITSITNAAPRVVTATAHGVVAGAPLIIVASSRGEVNRQWYGTVLTDDTFSLNGSKATGAVTGGTLVRGSFDWEQMDSKDWLDSREPDSRLRYWQWTDDVFTFVGATEQRLIEIRYINSGAAPESGDIGIDAATPFLATATAAYAASPYGMPQRAMELKQEAFGPSGQADGTGGKLRDLCLPMLQEKQNRKKQAAPIRYRKVFA